MRRTILGIAVAGLLAACGQQTSATPPSPTATPSPSATAVTTPSPEPVQPTTMTASVSAINFSFSPQTLSIRAGTRVTFVNRDSTTHTFTANNRSFNSGDVAPSQSFTFTFKSSGSFAYHCQIHASMTGTIVVSG